MENNQKRKVRLFEIFDQMNVNDTVNSTQTLPVGMDLVSADYKKNRGTVVSIGIEGQRINDIHFGKVRPLLVMLDMILYEDMKDQEVLDSVGLEATSAERLKQIDKHGFTAKYQAEHPEYYDRGQLVEAARMLTMWTDAETGVNTCRRPFNWDKVWFEKLMRKPWTDRVRIAAALLVAEQDRLAYIDQLNTSAQ